MSDFTKGKQYVFNNGTDIFVGSSESVGHICNVGWVKIKEVEANARLIAAAPEMYELLKEVAEVLRTRNNYDYIEGDLFSLMTEAEELLARIDGEEAQA